MEEDIWEQDLTSDMKIGLSLTGYQSVDLKCGADAFFVNATLDHGFDGVLYTRGDFKTKDPDCFVRSEEGKKSDGGVLFRVKIPFEKCHTLEVRLFTYKTCMIFIFCRMLRMSNLLTR